MTLEADVQNLANEVGVLQGEVTDLSTQTVNLLSAVNFQKTYLTTQTGLATTSAAAASNSASAAAASAASASTSSNNLTSAVAQANTARDAAVRAWRSASTASEQLPGIIGQFHVGPVVRAFIYDTSRDSDGGAWRWRCAHTSYYNEALNGNYLGLAANELAARGDNMLGYPEEIGMWTSNNGVVTLNYGATPEGVVASTLVVSGTRYYNRSGFVTNGTYLMMQIVKAGGGTGARIYLDASGGAITTVTFNFGTETFTAPSANIKATGFSKLTSDGWYMIWAYYTATGTTGSMHAYPVGGSVEYYAMKLQAVDVTGTALVVNTPPTYTPYSSLAGSYFHNTTDGKFYSLNAKYGVTEVFRGQRREVPAVSAIVIEANRAVVYDATLASMPMWAVFKVGAASYTTGSCLVVGTLSSVAAQNGNLYIGSAHATDGYLLTVSLAADTIYLQQAGNTYGGRYRGNIAARNDNVGYTNYNPAVLVNKIVYDVATWVPPDATIDVTTGLPRPVVAVATAGGINLLRSDGSVVRDTSTGNATVNASRVGFTPSGRLLRNFGTDNRRLGVYCGTNGQQQQPSANASLNSNWNIYGDPAVANGLPYTPAISVAAIAAGRDYIAAGNTGVSFIADAPSARTTTMIAYLTNAFNSGWMVGWTRGAWLADTVAETITASGELVANGTFDAGANGWTMSNATPTVANGVLTLTTGNIGSEGLAYQYISTVVGRAYVISAVIGGGAGAYVHVGESGNYLTLIPSGGAAAGFTAVSTSTRILLRTGSAVQGAVGTFDNVSVKLADADRSSSPVGLTVNGSLIKAPVANGAQLMGYSGFTSNNWLEQPYNTAHDFGTGDFSLSLWVQGAASLSTCSLLRKGTGAAGDGFHLYKETTTTNAYVTMTIGGATVVASAMPLNTPSWYFIVATRDSGTLSIWVNGVLAYTGASAADLSCNKPLQVGYHALNSDIPGLALVRISNTSTTPDQIAHIYRDELALFQPNAKCTIDGTTAAVTAVSYDDGADQMHVTTPWGRSSFHGLCRVESSATSIGIPTSVHATAGMHVVGGASGARFTKPSITLAAELKRKDEAQRAAASIPVPVRYVSTGTTNEFKLPLGYSVHSVYRQGIFMTPDGNDYNVSHDGHRWVVAFNTIPPVNYNICVMGVKNV